MWPFKDTTAAKVDAAVARFDKKIVDLVRSEQEVRARLAEAEKALGESRRTVAEQATKIRAQTEADLYLVSAKIMRDILATGTAKDTDAAKQYVLQQQMRGYSNAQQSSFFNNSAIGQSLFGSIFG